MSRRPDPDRQPDRTAGPPRAPDLDPAELLERLHAAERETREARAEAETATKALADSQRRRLRQTRLRRPPFGPKARQTADTPADGISRGGAEASTSSANERELRRALARLSIAQRAGRVGVFEWDLLTQEIYWTPEVGQLLGIARPGSDQYGAWAEIVHPDDLRRLEAFFAEWFKSPRDEEHWEYRIRRGGEQRWIEASGRLARDDDDRPVRVFGTALDITDRIRARDELLQKEQRLRAVLENVALGIAELDPDARVSFVNQRLCELLGYSREELVGMSIHELTAPEDRERSRELNGKVLSGELPRFAYEKQYLRKGGARLWVRVTVSALRDAAGRVLRAFGTIEDITERKRAEEALHLSQAWVEAERVRLQTIVENTPSGLFIFEADGRASLVNEEAKRIWAGTGRLESLADHVDYKGFWPGTGERLAAEDWPGAQALLRGRTTKGLVVDIERFDGTRGTVLASGAPIRDESGNIVGAVSANQDITELRRAQARLEEANRRKSEFLAVLSHELRNPLTPIRNSLYLLERAPAGGEQAARARQVIARQVRHLTRLVDDLLDVTRISRDKVRLQRERVDLCELVLRAAEDHRSIFAAAEIRLEARTRPPPLYADGDATRLAQVVGNLLSNAAKFTPRGGLVELWLDVEPAGDGAAALIHVRDNGAGIGPALLSKLFEPFVQADATLDRSKGGLGLGLALVKGLVELHGGRVAARSEGPGKGAEFVVRVPLAPIGASTDAECGGIAGSTR